MQQDDRSARDAIVRFIAGCETLVVFTGAGISTEAGVPDFRSPDSPWRVHKPIPFQDYIADPAARREAWRRKFAMDDLYRHARPGATHRFIAQGVTLGNVSHVVTQNIDNLHQMSGVPQERIVELHGNGSYAHCLACGARAELANVRAAFEAHGFAPDCSTCGGIVKSATVSFGQPMPVDALRRAREAMLNADGIIVLGSSLVVRPAATLPEIAKDSGAQLLIVNRERTPLDARADCVIRGDLPNILPDSWPH